LLVLGQGRLEKRLWPIVPIFFLSAASSSRDMCYLQHHKRSLEPT
jgi:hypothetical protein